MVGDPTPKVGFSPVHSAGLLHPTCRLSRGASLDSETKTPSGAPKRLAFSHGNVHLRATVVRLGLASIAHGDATEGRDDKITN